MRSCRPGTAGKKQHHRLTGCYGAAGDYWATPRASLRLCICFSWSEWVVQKCQAYGRLAPLEVCALKPAEQPELWERARTVSPPKSIMATAAESLLHPVLATQYWPTRTTFVVRCPPICRKPLLWSTLGANLFSVILCSSPTLRR